MFRWTRVLSESVDVDPQLEGKKYSIAIENGIPVTLLQYSREL